MFKLYTWYRPIRSIGISVSDFAHDNVPTQTDLFSDEHQRIRMEQLDGAVDVHSKKELAPMTQGKNTTDLTELLLKCMAEPNPMLSMLEWLCAQLMETEVSGLVGAEKNAHNPSRSDYHCGYRPRRLDTRVGTMYLMVPKLRSHGYIPFFVTERKRSEAALTGYSGGVRAGRVHTKDGKAGSQSGDREPLPQTSQ
jgi:hypothetical protein